MKKTKVLVIGSTGMLVDCGNGIKTYISESDLMDYAGMFLRGCDKNTNALVGKFPGVVLEEKQLNDRDVKPTKYADQNYNSSNIIITGNQ